jgi:hypothetical protein
MTSSLLLVTQTIHQTENEASLRSEPRPTKKLDFKGKLPKPYAKVNNKKEHH